MDACADLQRVEGVGLYVGAYLLLDDAALLLHLEAVELESREPIAEDERRAIEDVRLIGGEGDHIDGAVVTSHSIQPDAVACAETLCIALDTARGKVLRSAERQMLDEVCVACFVGTLNAGAHTHDEACLHLLAWLSIVSEDVAHPIGKRPSSLLGESGAGEGEEE